MKYLEHFVKSDGLNKSKVLQIQDEIQHLKIKITST